MVSHYDGFAPGIAGKPDSMLIPAFSLLIKQGTACFVIYKERNHKTSLI